jgi:dihydroorotase
MSLNGAAFYGLPQNRGTVTIERREWRLPETLPYPDSSLVPFRCGESLHWKQRLDD